MPHTTPDRVTRTFVGMVCADEGWLRAEFDAIIAANFPDRSLGGRRRAPEGPRVPGAPATRSGQAPASLTNVFPERWLARQRSPPDERRPTRTTWSKGKAGDAQS